MNYKRTLTICDNEILPGQHRVIDLPMPKLYDWTPMTMPVHVFRGKQDGPTLCVTAAIHGDEVNGIEIIRKLLKKPLLKKLHGTLIAIPIVNMYGFLYQSRYLMDRRDLNRCFPGSQNGSLAARLAHLLVTEIVSKATHMVDLHAGSLHRFNLPQIRTDYAIAESKNLANAFNVPVIINSPLREGSIRQYASENNIPFLLYEAGEPLRFDKVSIDIGLHGVLNVMGHLGMLPEQKHIKRFNPELTESSYWVRAPQSGILNPLKALGKRVMEGEPLAKIGNPTSAEEHILRSPLTGIIIGKSNLPMVHEGAALFHIAVFERPKLVAEQIRQLQAPYADDPEEMDYT